MEIAYPLKFFAPKERQVIEEQHPGFTADFSEPIAIPIAICQKCGVQGLILLEVIDPQSNSSQYSYRCCTCGKKGSFEQEKLTASKTWGLINTN